LEGQNKPVEPERDRLNIPKNELDEVREMQESAAFAPLIKAARGEPIDVKRLRHALIGGMDVAIESIGSDQQASNAFKKAREIIMYPIPYSTDVEL
jgi:hypothetical protein